MQCLLFLQRISSTRCREKRIPFFSLRMQSMTGSWPRSGCAPVTSTSTRPSPTFCAHIWCLRCLASPCTASCLPCTPFSRYNKLLPHLGGEDRRKGGGVPTSPQDCGWERLGRRGGSPRERAAQSLLGPEDIGRSRGLGLLWLWLALGEGAEFEETMSSALLCLIPAGSPTVTALLSPESCGH